MCRAYAGCLKGICGRRDALGSGGCRAAFLSPVPADCVVYGSGEAAIILTRVRLHSLIPESAQRKTRDCPVLTYGSPVHAHVRTGPPSIHPLDSLPFCWSLRHLLPMAPC